MSIILLFVAFWLFLMSLLVVLHAPTYNLWKFTIVVTELGHFLAIFPILIIIIAFGNLFISVLSFISLCLLLYPSVKGYLLSLRLSNEIKSAFGTSEKLFKNKPFSIKKLFSSKAFNAEVKTYTFKNYNSGILNLDFYSPSIKKNKNPLLIVIHGGAWSSGNNKDFIKMNEYFASQGVAVAAVTYRLAPKHLYPSQLDDINEAITFLKLKSEELNVDTSNIFLLGRSAGGQIALKVAYLSPINTFKGVIAIYTPADMVWGYAMPGNPMILDSRKVLRDYLGGSYEDSRENFHAASCVENIPEGAPPTLMVHGKRDEMVAHEHNLHLIAELDKLDVPNYLLTIPWATHGCDYFFNSPSAQLSTYAIHYFLNRYILVNA